MASWFEKGHPSILKAVQDICSQVDRELRAELDELQGQTQQQAEVNSRLTEENARLRQQVAVLQDAGSPTGSFTHPEPSEIPTADLTVPETDSKDWKTEYTNLSRRFNALSENFTKAKGIIEKRVKERDKWRQHADALSTRIRAAETEHGIRIMGRGASHGPSGRPRANNTTPIASILAGNVEAMTNITSPAVGVAPSSATAEVEFDDALPALKTPVHDDAPRVKQEPSSDGPIVVSERVIKKRRRSDGGEEHQGYVRVKREARESSVSSKSSDHVNIQESPDLGDALVRMSTPRKRRMWETPEFLVQGRPSLKDGGQAILPAVPSPHRTPFTSALMPLSVNRRLVRTEAPKKIEKRPQKDLGKRIAALAEDGATYEPETSTRPSWSARTGGNTVNRLNNLLNTTTGEEDYSDSPLRQRNRGIHRHQADLAVPQRRELPFKKSDRQSSAKGIEDSTSIAAASPVMSPPKRTPKVAPVSKAGRNDRLRSKPITDLRLEDFKINPATNDGEDYAYSEVVRGADRAGLSGCTDMRCCGPHFRALAKSQRPNPPLSAAEQEEETKLLENFLGDLAHRLKGMNEEQREELWVEAKAKELADKHGKCRQRFQRMHSPPGFWNADFPTTQELQAERSEAAAREKIVVEERYKEAMRPGGRWLFRDE